MDPATSPEISHARRLLLRGGLLAAAAGPILTEAHFAAAAAERLPPQAMGMPGGVPPAGAVMINANENPLGPCQAALDAMISIGPTGGRYDVRGEVTGLVRTFAEQNNLRPENVSVYAGSSEPLHYCVLAFTSPSRGLVMPDPTFEAASAAAGTSGAKVTKVGLTKTYAHDIKAMVTADPTAGVIYICNPNNPTGTLTPKEEIAWALQNKPKGSILLVDEAYLHFSGAPDVLDFVAADKDLIVLRTFSKIYGMAGIRCGFAVGRPDLLAQLRLWGNNPMSIMGSAAARASLLDSDLVPARRKILADIRTDTISWLTAHNHPVLGEPQTNCFLIETGREGSTVIAALQKKNIYIGRSWPIYPTAVRVTVGSAEDMARFKTAFREVMSA